MSSQYSKFEVMSNRLFYAATACVFVCILLFADNNILLVIRSKIQSWFGPIDYAYIKEREWVNKRGKILRFDESHTKIQGDKIFIDGNPVYEIRRLNRYLNEFIAVACEDKTKEVFMDTDEFTH